MDLMREIQRDSLVELTLPAIFCPVLMLWLAQEDGSQGSSLLDRISSIYSILLDFILFYCIYFRTESSSWFYTVLHHPIFFSYEPF